MMKCTQQLIDAKLNTKIGNHSVVRDPVDDLDEFYLHTTKVAVAIHYKKQLHVGFGDAHLASVKRARKDYVEYFRAKGYEIIDIQEKIEEYKGTTNINF